MMSESVGINPHPGAPASDLRLKVRDVRRLTPSVFVLRFDRGGLAFEPGQHVFLGPAGISDMREYSVFSAAQDPYLEVLVKEVEGGYLSPLLGASGPGDELALRGPFGQFIIPPEADDGRLLFVASGTGVAPFRSFVRSSPGLDYLLLHGVRTADELHARGDFEPARHISCLTRDERGDYRGRVTARLREHPVDPDTFCFLCGSCDMIFEAYAILRQQGVREDRLFAEVYF